MINMYNVCINFTISNLSEGENVSPRISPLPPSCPFVVARGLSWRVGRGEEAGAGTLVVREACPPGRRGLASWLCVQGNWTPNSPDLSDCRFYDTEYKC